MIQENQIRFLGLVETKKEKRNDGLVGNIWGSFVHIWIVVDAVNSGGGILCIWDTDFFQDNMVVKGDRWICVKGVMKDENFECAIGVVYGPHDYNSKRRI